MKAIEVNGFKFKDMMTGLSTFFASRVDETSDYRYLILSENMSYEDKKACLVREKVEYGRSFTFSDENEEVKTIFWKEKVSKRINEET